MAETKSLEHLALSLIEHQQEDIYQSNILPLYEQMYGRVKNLLQVLFALKDNQISLKSSYKGLDINSDDVAELMVNLEDEFRTSIPDEDVSGVCNVEGLVDYLTCNPSCNEKIGGDNKEAAELIERSLSGVKGIYKDVMDKIGKYFREKDLMLGLDMPLSSFKIENITEFHKALQDITNNTSKTTYFMEEGVPLYDVVGYVARRDIKLQLPSPNPV